MNKNNNKNIGIFSDLFEDFRWPPNKSSIKIALVGDGSVGKTSYFERLVSGGDANYRFNKNYDATQGCNVCQIEYMIGKYPVTIHIFDTAGQEKFGMLRDSYLMGVDGIILMYDITDRNTKTNVVSKWLPSIRRILDASQNKGNIPVIVVGNKYDKMETIRTNPFDEHYFRTASLIPQYESAGYGSIEQCLISVKADENLMQPINWLLERILSSLMKINIKRTGKAPNTYYCNQK